MLFALQMEGVERRKGMEFMKTIVDVAEKLQVFNVRFRAFLNEP